MGLDLSGDIYEGFVDPGANENFASGYLIRDRWINTLSKDEFVCVGDGVWKNTVDGSSSVTGPVQYPDTSTIQPTQITGNVTDYSITNLNQYSIVYLDASKKVDIKGIDRSMFQSGSSYKILFVNISPHDIKIKKYNGATTNQLASSNDITLKPNGSVELLSCSVIDKWIQINKY